MGTNAFSNMFDIAEAPQLNSLESLDLLGLIMQQQSLLGIGIESGYVYWGQFMAHDMSHVMNNQSTSHGQPSPIRQLTTPILDLSSVYGNRLIDSKIPLEPSTGKMILGYTEGDNGELFYGKDLPRNDDKLAAIADQRNDENLIISQLHLQFLKLHNFIVDTIKINNKKCNPMQNFAIAREQLILLYQLAILTDFLPTILHEDVYKAFFTSDPLSFAKRQLIADQKTNNRRTIEIEFAIAAFRFGHAMALDKYTLNGGTKNIKLRQLMRLTGIGNMDGHLYLPDSMSIDWRVFFKIDPKFLGINISRAITPTVHLRILDKKDPTQNGPLAVKNLRRGRQARLPSAQQIIAHLEKTDIAKKFNISPISIDDLNPNKILPDDLFLEIYNKTPLWYYLLAEAHAQSRDSSNTPQTTKLGRLGSYIVARTISQLLFNSKISVFRTIDRLNPDVAKIFNISIGKSPSLKMKSLLQRVNPEPN